MNIFQKIISRFKRNLLLNQFYDDLDNLDEVLLSKRLEIFEEIVTPKLASIGLTNWNGKYLWFSDFNEDGVKHVVEYNVFKVFSGAFSYGNCYSSVPTVSGGNHLINHRTSKSTKIIFFNRVKGWEDAVNSFEPMMKDKVSTANESRFRSTVSETLERNMPLFGHWFSENHRLDQNIKTLENELDSVASEFFQRTITHQYILGFLYAQLGEFEIAKNYLDAHCNRRITPDKDDVERKLLLGRIDRMKLDFNSKTRINKELYTGPPTNNK